MTLSMTEKYTVKEIAEMKGVNRRTAARWMTAGLLEHKVSLVNGRRYSTGMQLNRFDNDDKRISYGKI